jgi:hypothetical protein
MKHKHEFTFVREYNIDVEEEEMLVDLKNTVM